MQAIPLGLAELVARLDMGSYEKLEENVRYRLLALKNHYLTGFFFGRPRGRIVDSKSNVPAMCSTHVSRLNGTPRLAFQSWGRLHSFAA
jgi:hypothetical protein